jgi:hypothetical protein
VSVDDLLNFQAKAIDIGILDLVVVAIHKLSRQAWGLAQTRGMKVVVGQRFGQ